jgi:hypothetical protein
MLARSPLKNIKLLISTAITGDGTIIKYFIIFCSQLGKPVIRNSIKSCYYHCKCLQKLLATSVILCLYNDKTKFIKSISQANMHS